MANPDKDTIYVDIDDEITGIIDKLKGSQGKVVALVLPKRASVFQSIVNMKLLKRAADSSKKNVILITSEAGLLPLAGSAGIHVAKTLASRPEIPSAPAAFVDNDEAVDEDAGILPGEAAAEPLDDTKPVGQLAGQPETPPVSKAKDGVETLTLDNEEEAAAAGAGADAAKDAAENKAKKADKKKGKRLKVPNFNRFRLILALIVLVLIIIIAVFFLLNSSLQKATINISTDATNIPTTLGLNLSTTASGVNTNSGVIPAKYDQQQKTFSQEVTTTGQKNEGNEATGTIDMTAQYCGSIPTSELDVPAGTGVSTNGQTYITQQDTQFNIQGNPKNNCINYQATNSTSITAQSPGSAYNVSGVSFTVAGNYGGYTVSASGSASGGSDNIVQTVNQNDINNAKNKIDAGNASAVKSALESQLQGEGYYAITATFSPGSPSITSSAQVGNAASSVTVTETINYSMFGVKRGDLQSLINNSVDSQINTAKQSILDDGIDSASFNANSLSSSGGQVSMSTKVDVGPQLNVASIKKSAEGLKAGDIKSQLMTDPDVTGVNVSFSPFWVSSAPKNPAKITVDIAKPTTTKSER